jgi:GAF domain-containing protein
MTAATVACERKLKTVSRKLASAEKENAALKEKLAQARRRARTLGRATAASELKRELARSREEQRATREILRVVSSSVSDTRPVLDAIHASMLKLFEGFDGSIWLAEQDKINPVVAGGPTAPKNITELLAPVPRNRDSTQGKVVHDRKPVWIEDARTAPAISEAQRKVMLKVGRAAVLGVPMLGGDNQVAGVLIVSKPTPTKFTDDQVDLLQTFANQAVIAIENARLFNELEARNKDLAESLQHQAATSEVLRIVSQSFSDTKPVFAAIQQSLLDLFEGFDASVWLKQGDQVTAVAMGGPTLPQVDTFPSYPLNASNPTSRCVREGKLFAVEDVASDLRVDDEARELMLRRERRALLNAPLISQGEAVGMISVATTAPTKFTDKQIKLLQTFADQAVIAIQNVNLFNELQEIIRHQRATSNVLKIVGSSVSDAQPVFDGILDSVLTLFKGFDARVWMVEGNELKNVASGGDTKPALRRQSVAITEDPHFVALVNEGKSYRVHDIAADLTIDDARREWLLQRNRRAYAGVPLMRRGNAIGAITITNTQPIELSDSQMALLQTFADQAVIAIENARLFNELEARNEDLGQSLQQQKATSDVLRIVGSSFTDPKPVFDAIRLAMFASFPEATYASVWLRQDNKIVPVSMVDPDAPSLPLGRQSVLGRSLLDCRSIRIIDVLNDGSISEEDKKRLGRPEIRSQVVAPLILRGVGIGVIGVSSKAHNVFDDQDLGLIQTFADQAVIAIENTRLFNELEARNKELDESLKYQTATGEVLRIVSGSVADAQPVFDAILASVLGLFDGFDSTLWLVDAERCVPVAHGGPTLPKSPPPFPLDRDSMHGRAILER